MQKRIIGASKAAFSGSSLSYSGTRAYAWALVAMLWIISFLNYADRSVLSAVMP